MGYSTKWIENNLGITRDTIRYYEEKKLLKRIGEYRDYDDDDVKGIWFIKFLREVGFSTNEIYECMNNPDYDFDKELKLKITKLEKEVEAKTVCLQFLKSIEFTGRIPTPLKFENVHFTEFYERVQKECNLYKNSQTAPVMQLYDILTSMESGKLNLDEMEPITEFFADVNKLFEGAMNRSYYQIIAEMQEFGYESDAVQGIIRSFHKYVAENPPFPELEGKITSEMFARVMAKNCLVGEMGKIVEQWLGKEKQIFAARAIAHYGGKKIEEEIENVL